MTRIYLDNAATTAVRPEVLDAMLPFLRQSYANPSSPHSSGQAVRHALDAARAKTAAALGAKPYEVIFTGGGSEADNLAIFGLMDARADKGRGFITCAIEHHAVLHAADALRRRGDDVTVLPVDAEGKVEPQALRDALDDKTVLVSIMHANNEIGTIQNIKELASIAHERGALFHTDAIQTVGHVKLDVEDLGVDALALSAHKFEGPKGVGALYLRRGTRVKPRVVGGGQEFGKRAGTENVAGIVALATALELAVAEMEAESTRVETLRDRFIDEVCGKIEATALNGSRSTRLPNNASIRFEGTDASGVMIALDLAGIEVSTGSACTSGSLEPSHVLTAIGVPAEKARGTVRFSLGRTTTSAEIDAVIDALPSIIGKLRGVAASTLAQPLTAR
ncbi:MAG TPA: cysteine desulfurase family protein [Candidatus Eremiobacteraceae bacterium]|nr:cysteine desulfurase family protein [Candidatus Eremiobacteraceae bacterium]